MSPFELVLFHRSDAFVVHLFGPRAGEIYFQTKISFEPVSISRTRQDCIMQSHDKESIKRLPKIFCDVFYGKEYEPSCLDLAYNCGRISDDNVNQFLYEALNFNIMGVREWARFRYLQQPSNFHDEFNDLFKRAKVCSKLENDKPLKEKLNTFLQKILAIEGAYFLVSTYFKYSGATFPFHRLKREHQLSESDFKKLSDFWHVNSSDIYATILFNLPANVSRFDDDKQAEIEWQAYSERHQLSALLAHATTNHCLANIVHLNALASVLLQKSSGLLKIGGGEVGNTGGMSPNYVSFYENKDFLHTYGKFHGASLPMCYVVDKNTEWGKQVRDLISHKVNTMNGEVRVA